MESIQSELILLAHPSFGVLAILTAVWVFAETINNQATSYGRLRLLSLAGTLLMWLSYLVGGYWYVVYYGADKALIKAGPWPFAHSFFMEVKEHLFFSLLLMSTYLPIAVFGLTAGRVGLKPVVLWVSAWIVVLGLAMEGAGAFISMGTKVALLATQSMGETP
ncbi:hypothetical protein GCM10011352_18160 [Marinobacterium zhoushanense]|uniref:Rhodopsin n=1 Tax=Marinobacterium zhoushanense TaxID=1679163 RepID=A0ABQ1KA52_9GAMM|nr:hypothetical protein [Marinobacterium zhoushanense]GGB92468.1 hypothetical protein GCM10011352_18160 [Marinobacterium zhoushanense]